MFESSPGLGVLRLCHSLVAAAADPGLLDSLSIVLGYDRQALDLDIVNLEFLLVGFWSPECVSIATQQEA